MFRSLMFEKGILLANQNGCCMQGLLFFLLEDSGFASDMHPFSKKTIGEHFEKKNNQSLYTTALSW